MTILADGQVAITQSDIFEVSGADVLPTGKVSISKITFFNTGSIDQTTILYIKTVGGTARELAQFQLQENERAEYLEPSETLELDNGDSLQAKTTTASVVNFFVIGVRV